MSRRKIRNKNRITKPSFFTRHEWQTFTNGRAISKRRRAKKEEEAAEEKPEEDK